MPSNKGVIHPDLPCYHSCTRPYCDRTAAPKTANHEPDQGIPKNYNTTPIMGFLGITVHEPIMVVGSWLFSLGILMSWVDVTAVPDRSGGVSPTATSISGFPPKATSPAVTEWMQSESLFCISLFSLRKLQARNIMMSRTYRSSLVSKLNDRTPL